MLLWFLFLLRTCSLLVNKSLVEWEQEEIPERPRGLPHEPLHVCLHLVLSIVPFGPPVHRLEHISGEEIKTYQGLKTQMRLEPLLLSLLPRLPSPLLLLLPLLSPPL